MSPISDPIADVLIAQKAQTFAKIDIALAKQQQNATRDAGEAVNSLLEQAVVAQKQLSQGRIDVRV